jgi:hypothetical protein
MGKTVEFPVKMSPVVFWSAEFDNSPRHCWRGKDGLLHTEGNWEKICTLDHPELADKVGWMRFIHAVNRILKDTFDPWNEDIDSSTIGGFGSPKQLAQEMHDSEGKHWPGIEIYPDWIVYLSSKDREAKIELHNEDLIWIAEKAYNEVQAEYGR